MITLLSVGALVVSVAVYALRASSVRHDANSPRTRKRWISGFGVAVIAPVLMLISKEPGVDLPMVGMLFGMLAICFVMFIASFIRSSR